MPQDIPFTWSEDENMLYFVLQVRGAKSKQVDVALCDVYVKINCRPSLFSADLLHEVEPEHKQTMCKIGSSKISVSLRKRVPGLWGDFRAVGSKAALTVRRNAALAAAAERETDRLKLRDDKKEKMVKAGEHEQWRKDRENKEQVEKWEQAEKEKWQEELLSGFDASDKLLEGAGDAGEALDDDDMDRPDMEESVPAPKPVKKSAEMKTEVNPEKDFELPEVEVPQVCEVTDEEAADIRANKSQITASKPQVDKDAIWTEKDLNKDGEYEDYNIDVRDNPGKIGMRFSMRPRPGVPVRDNGSHREPPHPKNMVKSDLPPMLAGERDQDEEDPVWLKDKADNCMVAGDYQGAYNAYTEALKLGIHPNAFANRAVADMYLGNLEQCVEDCNRAIAIIDKRNKPPAGQPQPPCDPQDQMVRVRCEIRLGTAFLWLGAFKKAEDHFQKACDSEEGLEYEEKCRLKEDLARVQQARQALLLKEKADGAARRAHGSDELVQKELGVALGNYEEALKADSESAVIYANRCFANLRAGHLKECVEDADTALELLKRWPVARSAPKAPARPTRLDPPMLDDPSFVHPDMQKQGEVDWLMKHCGGSTKDLPELPDEYEWVKDVAEKTDDAWIAIRKKMTKQALDAIRDTTRALQDALYARNGYVIRDHIRVATELNARREGPSSKALKQAMDYADKIEAHAAEEEEKRLEEEAVAAKEVEEFDLLVSLDPSRTGVAKAGFVRSNPVECTQRRLFAKILLRRAKAHELLGDLEAGAADLRVVRRIEPENREAKQRLSAIVAPQPELAPEPSAASTAPVKPKGAEAVFALSSKAADPAADKPVAATIKPTEPSDVAGLEKVSGSARGGKQSIEAAVDEMLGEDEEEEVFDHAATDTLLQSAAEYMRKNDYQGALQIYHYVRRRCKVWETPVVELKVLSNTSLCLQRLRGRLPELVSACTEALKRIEEVRVEAPDSVTEDMLLNMECAVLSRRGNAYSQQQLQEQSNRDAARVRELLGKPA